MKKIVLFAPKEYRKLCKEAKSEICNGCGAKGGISFPSTFYGLDMSESCNIHDFMYYQGTTNQDKEQSDRVFLNNMLRIIEARSVWFLKPFRRNRARVYYLAVKHFGGPAFWADKNDTKDQVIV